MTLDPLDAEGLLTAAGDEDSAWSGMASGTTIGHVHLHVADLDRAEVFYPRKSAGIESIFIYPKNMPDVVSLLNSTV